jgi:hypothetical protein
MRVFRLALVVAIVAAMSAPAYPAGGKGLISGSYTLNWTQEVQKKDVSKDTRTFKQALETKYVGFLSPLIENEISLKLEYDKSGDTPSEIRLYPIITLTYKGAYWNAGSKRSIINDPSETQKVTDSHFVEMFYQPARFAMPDLKAKYLIDADSQAGVTDKFKQTITLSSAYQPVDWFNLKGQYNFTDDRERFKKDPNDKSGTPVVREEKYNVTAGIRHFFSDKLKLNSEWKSEFTRNASYFDNGVAKLDTVKEDQIHTMKNALAFRPFVDTAIDVNYDYDLKQTMVPKVEPGQPATEEHTLTYNAIVKVTQKIGTPVEVKGEYNRLKTDVRHNALPSINIDDAWTLEARGDFSKQILLNAKYTQHNILDDNPGAPNVIPKHTGSIARSASWTGELLPVWKPSVNYDRTDTHDHTIARGQFVKTSETKYSLKGPIDLKQLAATIEPSYDINIKNDYTNVEPQLQEVISTRDFKLRLAKMLMQTRTMELKAEHTYGRKIEYGHRDGALNNVNRSDASTVNFAVKDVIPNLTGGVDITRTATDTSGDADAADVTENFAVKADYKYSALSWNALYKYDRSLRSDKTNKWSFDWKATWTARDWDLSLTYNQTKTLSFLRDESYKVGVDFKYNF